MKERGTQNNAHGGYVLHRSMSQQVSCQNRAAADCRKIPSHENETLVMLVRYGHMQVWAMTACSSHSQIYYYTVHSGGVL